MIEAKAKELWDRDHPFGPPWQDRTPAILQVTYVREACRIIAERRKVGLICG